jgi:hypothetical protein
LAIRPAVKKRAASSSAPKARDGTGVAQSVRVMMHIIRTASIASLTVLSLAALPASAHAASITFDLTAAPASSSGSGMGNSMTFASGGLSVTVTAWGYTYGSNAALEEARLRSWSAGLGVCNQNEGSNCSSPNHYVDNQSSRDWVLFEFSQTVDPFSVRVDPVGSNDRDASYWVGSVTTPLDLTATTYAGLGARGFGSRFDEETGSNSSADYVFSIGGGPGNALLFGTALFASNDFDDRFKIEALTVDTVDPPVVPEPASVLLVGTGLGLAARLARRRKARA